MDKLSIKPTGIIIEGNEHLIRFAVSLIKNDKHINQTYYLSINSDEKFYIEGKDIKFYYQEMTNN